MESIAVKRQSETELWKRALAELKLQLPKGTFNLWLANSHASKLDGDVLTVVVEHENGKDWIANRLREVIERTVSAVAGEPMSINVITKNENIQSIKNGRPAPPPPVVKVAKNGTVTGSAPPGPADPEIERGVEIEGKRPTRERAVPNAAYLRLSHYAVRFWLPALGCRAFTIWQAINTFKAGIDWGWNDEPTVKDIMAAAGISSHAYFRSALEDLQKHGLLEVGERTDNLKSTHLFTISEFPIMTFDQHVDLLRDRALMDAHMQWLERFASKGYFDLRKWRAGYDPEECILVTNYANN